MEKGAVNKDLILREKLALERTDMANDRTFLSFIRTSLYFAIAGMTINEIIDVSYGGIIRIVFYILSALILISGIYKFSMQKRKLKENKQHIGNYRLEWEADK